MLKPLTVCLLAFLLLLGAVACTASPAEGETAPPNTTSADAPPPTADTQPPDEVPTEAPTQKETEAPKPERTVTDMYSDGYNVNMLVGFDEYGRSLTPVSSRKEDKEVGIFYFLWLGQHGATEIYNIDTIFLHYIYQSCNFVSGTFSIKIFIKNFYFCRFKRCLNNFCISLSSGRRNYDQCFFPKFRNIRSKVCHFTCSLYIFTWCNNNFSHKNLHFFTFFNSLTSYMCSCNNFSRYFSCYFVCITKHRLYILKANYLCYTPIQDTHQIKQL